MNRLPLRRPTPHPHPSRAPQMRPGSHPRNATRSICYAQHDDIDAWLQTKRRRTFDRYTERTAFEATSRETPVTPVHSTDAVTSSSEESRVISCTRSKEDAEDGDSKRQTMARKRTRVLTSLCFPPRRRCRWIAETLFDGSLDHQNSKSY